jgi:hypothetical protein
MTVVILSLIDLHDTILLVRASIHLIVIVIKALEWLGNNVFVRWVLWHGTHIAVTLFIFRVEVDVWLLPLYFAALLEDVVLRLIKDRERLWGCLIFAILIKLWFLLYLIFVFFFFLRVLINLRRCFNYNILFLGVHIRDWWESIFLLVIISWLIGVLFQSRITFAFLCIIDIKVILLRILIC